MATANDPDDDMMEISLDAESDCDIVPPSDAEELDEDAPPHGQRVDQDSDAELDKELSQIARALEQDAPSSDEDTSAFEENVNDSDGEDDLVSQAVQANLYPNRPMQLVQPPQEYDIDHVNEWVQLDERERDSGFEGGIPPFTGAMSATVQGRAPMDYFDFLFSDSMWGEIAIQTNEYAQSRLEKLGPDAVARMDHPDFKKKSRLNFWKPVTAENICVFAAHLIILGLVKKPELEEYWSRKALTRTPFFGQFMARDRFQMILSNLHLTDDSGNPPYGQPGHNPLAKVQPFIDMINPKFKTAYKPGENISVDEGCCPWKGRLRFRQYNPRKPAKFHVKLFQVLDPATGYVLHFSVYTGKGSCHENGHTANDAEHTTTTLTVMTLCAQAQVLDKGHCVYFDNFFTSPQLLQELFARDTVACGTARTRAFGPQALQANTPKLALGPGESCALRCGPMLAFKWRQTKPKTVYMMTTKHLAEEGYSGKLDRATKTPIYKPVAVLDYTRQMGGVDLSDQLMNYYNFLRRGCKWWRKLFVHLFNMVILNAYVLNKTFGLQNKLTHHEYRYVVAAALLNFHEVDAGVPSAGPPVPVPFMNREHWPERLPTSTKTGKTKTRKCKYCFVSAKAAATGLKPRNEKSTTIMCKACRVPLCVVPCFGLFHEKQ